MQSKQPALPPYRKTSIPIDTYPNFFKLLKKNTRTPISEDDIINRLALNDILTGWKKKKPTTQPKKSLPTKKRSNPTPSVSTKKKTSTTEKTKTKSPKKPDSPPTPLVHCYKMYLKYYLKTHTTMDPKMITQLVNKHAMSKDRLKESLVTKGGLTKPQVDKFFRCNHFWYKAPS